MAYNLYQVQMARGWQERIEKEQMLQERFWAQQAQLQTSPRSPKSRTCDERSRVGAAPSVARTGTTMALVDRLSALEDQLRAERGARQKLEEEVMLLKTSSSLSSTGSKPGTPRTIV
mmetsp:Transcript_39502/g.117490  ORF Transcript_39502/g.117490 Transcript_39502/m.117490 type:complete len:117 (-) Transcript_39502:842-1192(-)